jgi:hypothetical protein
MAGDVEKGSSTCGCFPVSKGAKAGKVAENTVCCVANCCEKPDVNAERRTGSDSARLGAKAVLDCATAPALPIVGCGWLDTDATLRCTVGFPVLPCQARSTAPERHGGRSNENSGVAAGALHSATSGLSKNSGDVDAHVSTSPESSIASLPREIAALGRTIMGRDEIDDFR